MLLEPLGGGESKTISRLESHSCLEGSVFFKRHFLVMAKGCHDSPAAKGWILTSPCLWSCDQQHLGDVAEVADTSVMQRHVMLRCVMSCYVMLSYPWDSNHH